MSPRNLLATIAMLMGFGFPLRAIDIPLVTVGDPGNAADPATGFGKVDYRYQIGTYEVTNTEYAAFLNAVAKSDPLGLYNSTMGADAQGGITQSGVDGSFLYTVKSGFESKPVNLVSYCDSLRFVNWLSNGQTNTGTETGSYTLQGGTAVPTNASTLARNPSATFVIPSEDEWYKAAYYRGSDQTYTLYPTQSNTTPDQVGPNSMDANSGNFGNFGGTGALTDVGAYSAAVSYYGTFDQGGNVIERDEAIIGGTNSGSRGGSYRLPVAFLESTIRDSDASSLEYIDIGFRVAYVSPTPTPTPTPPPAAPAPTPVAVTNPQPPEVAKKTPTHTSRPTIKIQGTLPDAQDHVEYRTGSMSHFRKASGGAKWRIDAPLKVGINIVLIRTVDGPTGAVSPVKRVKVIRSRSAG